MGKKHRHIAVYITLDTGYSRSIIQGIADYARQHMDWTVHLQFRDTPARFDKRSLERFDGLIVRLHQKRQDNSLVKTGVPTVNISALLPPTRIPTVVTDNITVGAMAAEHLLRLRATNFAFCGYPGPYYTAQRKLGFDMRLKQDGFTCSHYFKFPAFQTWINNPGIETEMTRWLTQLPKPVGLFTHTDTAGWTMAEACQLAELRVPEDIAIISVDNDELLCQLARPKLSSVDTGTQRVGHEAARLLNEMIDGRPIPQSPLVIPPVSVVERQSSDIVFVQDSMLVSAIRFIRDNIEEAINVEDVVEYVCVSRSTLERRFLNQFNRSVADEIRRTRLERAKYLLTRTDLTLMQVAIRCGYPFQQRMSTCFREHLNMSPSQYRKQYKIR